MELKYFLMHEIRHYFQKEVIDDFKKTGSCVLSPTIVKKWISEKVHYQTAKNFDGPVNTTYFEQDCEMDAYAYSFAIMKFKYGSKANVLYLPTAPIFGALLMNVRKSCSSGLSLGQTQQFSFLFEDARISVFSIPVIRTLTKSIRSIDTVCRV